jgi:hypothetical protein
MHCYKISNLFLGKCSYVDIFLCGQALLCNTSAVQYSEMV